MSLRLELSSGKHFSTSIGPLWGNIFCLLSNERTILRRFFLITHIHSLFDLINLLILLLQVNLVLRLKLSGVFIEPLLYLSIFGVHIVHSPDLADIYVAIFCLNLLECVEGFFERNKRFYIDGFAKNSLLIFVFSISIVHLIDCIIKLEFCSADRIDITLNIGLH